MTMRSLLVALFLLPLAQQALAQQAPPTPAGDPERGKALWLKTEHVECRECHGDNGEGGFGPDLAGRNLTRAQFIHAVRKPWGIMPAFAESQISDRELVDLMAYFDTSAGRRPAGTLETSGAGGGLARAGGRDDRRVHPMPRSRVQQRTRRDGRDRCEFRVVQGDCLRASGRLSADPCSPWRAAGTSAWRWAVSPPLACRNRRCRTCGRTSSTWDFAPGCTGS